MKKLILSVLILLFCLSQNVKAQNCKNILLLQNGKKIEMTIYNKKGKEDGKQIWKINNVRSTSNHTTGTISSEFFDNKGKSLNTAVNEIKCSGGSIQMNMKMMLNEAQLKQIGNAKINATGEFLDYPFNVKENDKLKDGNLQLAIESDNGLNTTITLDITNRVIVGKETIISPAGTWECFKIKSDQKLLTKIAGIGIPMKTQVTEWYAPGVGVIKTESKWGSTLITSIQ